MKNMKLASVSALSIAAASFASSAQAEDLTLCWAAWDPANALVELSKEFEAASGHSMSFEFIPWPNFADRMLNELNSCLLYTSPSPRDRQKSRMPSSA